ncbi:MAG: proton-conducting transporter membrane subunit [bacterium]
MLAKFIFLSPFIFLFVSLIIYLFGSYLPRKGGFLNFITLIFCITLSFAALARTVNGSFSLPKEINFNFITVYFYKLNFSLRIDGISIIIMLLIGLCVALVHAYSVGLMEGKDWEKDYNICFSLSLFSIFLLNLSSNYLLMVFCLEIAALSGYGSVLLTSNQNEIKQIYYKSWIAVRISDFCFITGVLILFTKCGTLNIEQVLLHMNLNFLPEYEVLTIGLLFLAAVLGRVSAFPWYSWLSDLFGDSNASIGIITVICVAGSGIILLLKSFPMIMNSSLLLDFTIIAGVFTFIIGAIAACLTMDLKKLIAHSIISQCGFMLFVFGLGLFQWVVFVFLHYILIYSLFFMLVSSIIFMFASQDLRRMGGIAKRMPIVAINFFILTLAMSCFPLFSTFWGMGGIMEEILSANNSLYMSFFVIFNLLTSIYMGRACSLIFFGQPRDIHLFERTIDPPLFMDIPLIFSTLLMVIGGWILSLTDILKKIMPFSIYSFTAIDTVIAHDGSIMKWGLVFISIFGLFAGWILANITLKQPHLLLSSLKYSEPQSYLNKIYEYILCLFTGFLNRSISLIEMGIQNSPSIIVKEILRFNNDLFLTLENTTKSLSGKIFDNIKTLAFFIQKIQSGRISHYVLLTVMIILILAWVNILIY